MYERLIECRLIFSGQSLSRVLRLQRSFGCEVVVLQNDYIPLVASLFIAGCFDSTPAAFQ